ncbi:SIR2 family protein [Thioalkalivibrio sp. HK1]|uniref:SIR2 family protein n=1 Tax=Thioalkalivibrio sp. HK1 TaxID=1469245 RepID=UPI0004B40F95|nr:SIR2 family protein [Thioalkalivibrio sp. HK1]
MKSYFENRFCEYLDSSWTVSIAGNEYQSSEVFKICDPTSYDASFTEWIEDQKDSARQRVKEFLSERGCLQRFNRLAEQVINNQVLPFVGAGMSKPSGFVLWRTFLKELAKEDSGVESKIEELILKGHFEDAAQCIVDHFNENILAEQVENYFYRQLFEVKGPVLLLPSLFNQGCMTTNFDIVLEKTYREHGSEFDNILVGDELKKICNNAEIDGHMLFKIHGSANNATGRILTTREYEEVYERDKSLPDLFAKLVVNRSLLFLGCSLSMDRTFQALRQIKININSKKSNKRLNIRHYALLADPGFEEIPCRRSDLEKAEIHPIWYPLKEGIMDHDSCIEDILVALSVGPINE